MNTFGNWKFVRILTRKSAFLCAAAMFIGFANGLVSACTVREEAMPQLLETSRQTNLFGYAALILFAGIVGLYFLNLIVNRKWLSTVLFPFSALAVFFVSIAYTLVFAPMGFCGLSETYWAALITLGLTTILFVAQLILFVKTTRRRKLETV